MEDPRHPDTGTPLRPGDTRSNSQMPPPGRSKMAESVELDNPSTEHNDYINYGQTHYYGDNCPGGHLDDTAPFDVAAFLDYLAALDNCDDATADYYDSIVPATDFYNDNEQ